MCLTLCLAGETGLEPAADGFGEWGSRTIININQIEPLLINKGFLI
jgi:hypothetical protein